MRRIAPTTNLQRQLLLAALLAVVVASFFHGSLAAVFITLDDPSYVTRNAMVRRGLGLQSVWWAVSGIHNVNWSPLTWLSLMLDSEIFGLDPWGYHLTNLLLHIASSVLFFWALQSMTHSLWRSFLAALLFGVHPLHVEPVAWVASRKDVLSAFFWMLTLLLYARHVQRSGERLPALGIVAFALGLMAKAYVFTLPLVLLLLDFWPLGRWQRGAADGPPRIRLLKEKWPLFALAVVVAAVNIVAQASIGRDIDAGYLSFGTRLGNAFAFLMAYLHRAFWPAGLAIEYPHPLDSLPLLVALTCAATLVSISLAALWTMRTRPYFFLGWFWFVVGIAPALQIRQVGNQGMADRFMYLPLAGLCIASSWALPDVLRWFSKGRSRARDRVAILVSACLVGVLGVASHRQLQHWSSSVDVFSHSVQVAPGNYWASVHLAESWMLRGRTDAAESAYRNALETNPDSSYVFEALGRVLAEQGRIEELMDYVRPLYNWRSATYPKHFERGRILHAVSQSAALRGVYSRETGRRPVDDAIRHWEAALSLLPGVPKSLEIREVLARLHLRRNNPARAEQLAREWLARSRGREQEASAHALLAASLLRGAKIAEARQHALEALRIEPGNASASDTLARIEGNPVRPRPGPERGPGAGR